MSTADRTLHRADVMFTIASNTPVKLGIGKESVTEKPSGTFPYVPSAHVRSAA